MGRLVLSGSSSYGDVWRRAFRAEWKHAGLQKVIFSVLARRAHGWCDRAQHACGELKGVRNKKTRGQNR